jgi:alanine racemase
MNELTWVEISLPALANNLALAREAAGNSKIMAVIKADAYGHGAVAVAKALSDADAFAIARIDEGIQLRNHGIQKPIVVLGGIHSAREVALAIEFQLQPVIHAIADAELLDEFHPATPLPVWLKVDTGMHRLGVPSQHFREALEAIQSKKHLSLQGVMTHLSDAEELDGAKNHQQQSLFESLTEGTAITARSMANSAGILLHPSTHYEWVRPGIMLYGSNPASEENKFTSQLTPVMTFKSKVVSTRRLNAGESVGYNGTWQATTPCTIATIAAGYGDGYPRHATNGTPVLIRNKRYPLAGRVSMDLITVNVGDDDIAVGETVVLWGEGLPANVIAKSAGTISYQLFCGITPRVKRIYRTTD